MSLKKPIILPAGVFVLMLCMCMAVAAWGSTAEKLSLDQLIERSDVIARGRVADIKTQRSGQGSVSTLINITVEKQFKGARLASVAVEQRGGAMGDVALAVPGSAKFSAGEDVIVFLAHRREGLFTVVGGPQGKFTAQIGAGGDTIENFARETEPLGRFVDRLTSKLQGRG
jgi:hypothetical protein